MEKGECVETCRTENVSLVRDASHCLVWDPEGRKKPCEFLEFNRTIGDYQCSHDGCARASGRFYFLVSEEQELRVCDACDLSHQFYYVESDSADVPRRCVDDCADIGQNVLVFDHQCVDECPAGTIQFEHRCLQTCFQNFDVKDETCVTKKAANHSSSWVGVGIALGAAVVFASLTVFNACRRRPRAFREYDSYVMKRGVELHNNAVGAARRK